jgi:hypothetical protein
MMDTVTERRALFQSLVMAMELKYGITTKQAIKDLTNEMKQACDANWSGHIDKFA